MNFTEPTAFEPGDEKRREAAARWVVRRDRGLNAAEALEFEGWLAASPRHAAAFNRALQSWKMLERIPAEIATPIANAVRPPRLAIRRYRAGFGILAAAAAIAAVFHVFYDSAPKSRGFDLRDQHAGSLHTQILSDGTVVRLNTGAAIATEFTARQRSVRLMRGEAYFAVSKNPARPFVVYAGTVAVRAVGTAFNVNLQSRAVDVLVAEGVVQVKHALDERPAKELSTSGREHTASAAGDSAAPFVPAGHRALVRLPSVANANPATIEVSAIDPAALSKALAWREPLLKLGGASLGEVAVQFQRLTGRRMTIANPKLARLRIGGFFPSDDPEGFVRVLEENYRITSTRAADGSLVLDQAP